jgi:hypothetical protein
MEKGFAECFADEWIAAWNSHDLDRIAPLLAVRVRSHENPGNSSPWPSESSG